MDIGAILSERAGQSLVTRQEQELLVSERHAALREAFTNLSLLSAAGRAARHGQDLVEPTSLTLPAA